MSVLSSGLLLVVETTFQCCYFLQPHQKMTKRIRRCWSARQLHVALYIPPGEKDPGWKHHHSCQDRKLRLQRLSFCKASMSSALCTSESADKVKCMRKKIIFLEKKHLLLWWTIKAANDEDGAIWRYLDTGQLFVYFYIVQVATECGTAAATATHSWTWRSVQ